MKPKDQATRVAELAADWGLDIEKTKEQLEAMGIDHHDKCMHKMEEEYNE